MRAAVKYISKANLTDNLNTLADLAPDSQCVAVVKANAYGCEAPLVYDALSRADLFAVAAIEEALALRQAGADKPILLLEGAFEPDDVGLAAEQNFELMIATQQQLNWLLDSDKTFSRLWFKLDTGMGRLGFQVGVSENDADVAMQRLLKKYAEEDIVITTHFSDADNPDRSITLGQIERFDAFASRYPHCRQSLCNSAGTLAYPDAHRDFIRPGIALYGASPFAGNYGEDHGLKAVMTLKTRVLSVKSFKQGEPIGYSRTYRMEKDGKVAICEIGYADGYSRFIPSGSPILINNVAYSVIGRVSMDMIAVLVDNDDMENQVRVGDKVVCWGEGLPIERLCEAADTIPYQLLTTVTERPKKVIE